MKKIILLLLITIYINAIENKKGYTLHNVDVKDKTALGSKKINQLKYKEEVLILSVKFDENNDYWYKTKYGFIYGKSITTDLRYVNADLLHIRTKPSLKGIEISYFLMGDQVIIIQDEEKSDGFNWVFTTEGYVSSDYLTPKLIDNRIELKTTKILKFRQSPTKIAKVIKEIKSTKIKFIVKKSININQIKSKKEQKIEQKIAIIKNKNNTEFQEKIAIIKKIITIDKIKKERKKKIKKKEIIIIKEPIEIDISMISIDYKVAKTKNNYNQSSPIGETLSKDGTSLSIQANLNIGYLPKSYLLFSSYEYISYSMREKHNILIGTKKIFNLNKTFLPYIQVGVGLSKLNWTQDPLASSTSTVKNSTSLHYSFGIGGYYKLSESFDIDIYMTQNYQNHTTKLTLGIQNSTIEDKSSLKYGLGLRYKF